MDSSTLEDRIAEAKEEVRILSARRIVIIKGYRDAHGGYLKEAIDFANSVVSEAMVGEIHP